MKKAIGIVLALVIMFTLIVPIQAEDDVLNYVFLSGIGRAVSDSIPISTREELENIKNNLSGNYHLTTNIDLSGAEWNPIGDSDNRFSGTFDGQGYVIRNMKILSANTSSGLFAYSYKATIKNLGMYGTNIVVNSGYAGSIVGTAYGTRISNCFNNGKITSSSYAGGIVGYAGYYMKNYAEYVSTISNCYNIGNIDGSYAGGICGYVSWSNINNCCNTGIINGSSAGGICGFSNGNISTCWNSGSVSGTSYAGGIAGGFSFRSSMGWASSTTLQNCYNKGSISGASCAGGITGRASSDYIYIAKINNCYNVGDVSGNSSGICWADTNSQITNCYCFDLYRGTLGTQLTIEEMLDSTYLVGLDFNSTWRMSPNINSGYPYLRALPVKIDTNNAISVSSVSMMSPSATIKVGDTYQAMAYCMPINVTDKALTWSTNNPLVATVNNNGVVTAKGPGKATITAKSNNGKIASCIVTVIAQNKIDFEKYYYSFFNHYSTFDYEADEKGDCEKIKEERYEQLGLKPSKAEKNYNKSGKKWNGNCFGMSVSLVLFYKNILKEEHYQDASFPYELTTFVDSEPNYKLIKMIELFQISQCLGYETSCMDTSLIVDEIDKGNPCIIGLEGPEYAHSLIVHGYSKSGSEYTFHTRDVNRDISKIVYSNNTWNIENNLANYKPKRIYTYASLKKIYDQIYKKKKAVSLFSVQENASSTYLFTSASNLTITNISNQMSRIIGGDVSGEIENVKLIASSYLAEEPIYTIILPTDTYTIVGSGDEVITTSFADDYMSASVTAKSSVPITISSDLKEITVDALVDEEYDITYTTYDNIFDEMNLSGTATGTLTTKLNDADILISGVETLTASASVSDSVVSTNSDSLSNSDEIIVKCEETDSGATIQILSAGEELTDKTSLPERLIVDMPAYDLASGTYIEGQVLNFTKDDETIIYYTTDGSIPSADNGIIYSLPIDINKSMTVKALSTKYGYLDSEIVELNYTLPEVDMPQANVESGEYDKVITVELSTGNYEDTIYYTLDGSSPLENGILYTVPINISEDAYLQTYTLRNGCISEISEYEYTVTPTYPFYFSNSLTNQDGEIITPDNIVGVTKVKMILSKLHTGDHTGVFLIAFYDDDNRLVYANFKSATISEDIDEVEIDITEDVSSAYKVKAFAWKDLSSIKPICEAMEENLIVE